MTASQGRALTTIAAVLGVGLLGGWFLGAWDAPRARNPWITLRRRSKTGHRQRVFIDDDGRIELGLPDKYRGIRIGDLTKVGRQVRHMKKRAGRARRALTSRSRERFRSKDVAVKALLDANPQLHDFVQAEWGQSSQEYLHWLKRGRRGVKPQLGSYDGRFDAINYGHDLHGPKAVGSWLEALYATAPTSGRWEDFGERLPALEEATGLRLELPDQAARLARRADDLDRFDEGVELEEGEIYDHARAAAGGGDGDVPF